jgi:prepilin-type N-terminal cleavage/methylation domain-containing protein
MTANTNPKGVTLIELLIALVISSILTAAIYRTFISQQRIFAEEEQVVEMQQNARVAINQMLKEIRMAGFGNVEDVLGRPGGVNGFSAIITPNGNGRVTVVAAFKEIAALAEDAVAGSHTLKLTGMTDAFDRPRHRFLSIISSEGAESNTVTSRSGNALTLENPLKFTHRVVNDTGHGRRIPVFKIQAVTYVCGMSGRTPVLQRNENTGGGGQPVAENIENLEFEYYDGNGNLTATPSQIRAVRVGVTARTELPDAQLRSGDGYKRRRLSSNVCVRNSGLSH